MSKQFPKIELLLSDISQEYPPSQKMREMFSWYSGDWGHDWDDSHSGPGADEHGNPYIPEKLTIDKLKIRPEDFGGIVFAPHTKRVLKTNKQAHNIIESMIRGDVESQGFDSKAIEYVKNIMDNEMVKIKN